MERRTEEGESANDKSVKQEVELEARKPY